MSLRLKKEVIDIYKELKKKKSEVYASDLADELKIDYIVLMSAVNDLKDNGLADFKEEEVDLVSLNEEGQDYLMKGLPERQLLNIILDNDIKEISVNDLLEFSLPTRKERPLKKNEGNSYSRPRWTRRDYYGFYFGRSLFYKRGICFCFSAFWSSAYGGSDECVC